MTSRVFPGKRTVWITAFVRVVQAAAVVLGCAVPAYALPARCESDRNFYMFSSVDASTLRSESFRAPGGRRVGTYLASSLNRDGALSWGSLHNNANDKIFDSPERPLIAWGGIYIDGQLVSDVDRSNTHLLEKIVANEPLPYAMEWFIRGGLTRLARYLGVVLDCSTYNRLVAGKITQIGGNYRFYILNGGNIYEERAFDQQVANAAIDRLIVDKDRYIASARATIAPQIEKMLEGVGCHSAQAVEGIRRSMLNFEIINRELYNGNGQLRVAVVDHRPWKPEAVFDGYIVRDTAAEMISHLMDALAKCVKPETVAANPHIARGFGCGDCSVERDYTPRLVAIATLYAGKVKRIAPIIGRSLDYFTDLKAFRDAGLSIDGADALLNDEGPLTMRLDFDIAGDGSPTANDITRVVNGYYLETCDFGSVFARATDASEELRPLLSTRMERGGNVCVIQTVGARLTSRIGNVSRQSCEKGWIGSTYQCRFTASMIVNSSPPMPFFGGLFRDLMMPVLTWRFERAGDRWIGRPVQ